MAADPVQWHRRWCWNGWTVRRSDNEWIAHHEDGACLHAKTRREAMFLAEAQSRTMPIFKTETIRDGDRVYVESDIL